MDGDVEFGIIAALRFGFVDLIRSESKLIALDPIRMEPMKE